MAVAKSTKKSTSKTSKASSKVASAKIKKTSNKPATAKVTKTTQRALKSTSNKRVALKSKTRLPAKKTTVKASGKMSASSIKVVDFVAGMLKQATKAQKLSNSQCKDLSKQVDGLDKKYAQLSEKQSSSKGRGLQALEKQLSKIKMQATVVRTSLLKAENNKDKITSLVDFASKLNAPATSVNS